ncbi:MAG: Panacea domain-containing protein [Cyanophyceae cyanobacterium]
MIKALDVARFFVEKGADDPEMTQLKVQKLTFYAQSYHLGIYGTPLFGEAVRAWKHGPVITSLRSLQDCRGNKIPADGSFGNPIEDPEALKFLEAIWSTYGCFSADLLVGMTHADPPWIEARKLDGQSPEITQEAMRDYFSSRADDIDLESGDVSIESIFGEGAFAVSSPIG